MFQADIAQLRTLLRRVVTAPTSDPDEQQHLNAAYDHLVQAIAHLEAVQTPAPFQYQDAPVADLFEAIAQEERLRELG